MSKRLDKKKHSFIFEFRCELMLMAFFAVHIVMMIPELEKVSHYVTTHYLLTYEFGFNSRFMVGSIVSLFTDNVTYTMFYAIAIVTFSLLAGLISVLLGRFIKNAVDDEKESVEIFVCLFLASTYSSLYLLQRHIGRMDTIWFILTLASLVFLKNKYLKWFVPLLCFIAVAVHQGYLVTYMPAVAIPLLYEVCRTKCSKKSIAVFVLSCVTMIVFFLIFQLFPTELPFATAQEFAAYLSKRTSMVVSEPMLYLEYFSPIKEWLYKCMIPLSKSLVVPVMTANIVTSAPILIVVYYLWISSFRKTDNKFLKFVFLLCMLAPIMFVPAAVAGTDEDRWWAAVMNVQFILVFFMFYSREKTIVSGVKKVGCFFKKNYLLLFLIIIFTGSLVFSDTSVLVFKKMDMREYVNFFKEVGCNYRS